MARALILKDKLAKTGAKMAFLSTFALAATGCSTPPPTVSVPVAISCLPAATPSKPATSSNAELAAMTDERLVLTIAAERLDLIFYSAKADAVIQACK